MGPPLTMPRMYRLRRARALMVAMLGIFAFVDASLSFASVATAASPAHACDGQVSSGTDSCPCCPDGSAGLAGCSSVCGIQAFTSPMLPIAISPAKFADFRFTTAGQPTLRGPPPNPPPIR